MHELSFNLYVEAWTHKFPSLDALLYLKRPVNLFCSCKWACLS